MSATSARISNPTPMMQQYLQIKDNHKDCILFFRMGDFYEMFFEDAIIASPILEIALTKRGKADSQDIPMCGVPHHSHEIYMQKLIKAGYKIAICDQLETPIEAKKRGGHKEVVKRDVVRIVTQGTLTEDNLLHGKTGNYLLSLYRTKNVIAISYADISTLEFKTFNTTEDQLLDDIAKICPSEIITSDSFVLEPKFKDLFSQYKSKIVTFVDSFFSLNKNRKRIENNYNIKTIEVFGDFNDAQIATCGSLVDYICITQKKETAPLHPPAIVETSNYMTIDSTAQKNLELFWGLNDNNSALIKTIDKTLSNAGGRLLRHHLSFPSSEPKIINDRYDLIEFFIKEQDLRKKVREKIKESGDLDRSIAKLAHGRGSPRELYSIKNDLAIAQQLSELLCISTNKNLYKFSTDLLNANQTYDLLKSALIVQDLYYNQNDYVKPSFHPELATLYNFRDNSSNLVKDLTEEYKSKTGISNLKVQFNNVVGYYIEVTKSHLNKLDDIEEFVHRQSMVNANRYTTEKLKEVEDKILASKSQIESLEQKIFLELSGEIIAYNKHLSIVSNTIAIIDIASSMAELAHEHNYCRPIIDESDRFDIVNGRHPVVEKNIEKSPGNDFIANNCKLENSQKLWLLTGPNMAGKSTFLRQNAIITIMAQIGSYVPAESAHIGIVDRVFSRVGAGDDLAQGRSTFLVEMIETSSILNQATKKSLVILDEIGRGTSTYDGLAIAWSCLEYIHNKIKCRTLFATHYHELTELKNNLNLLKCYTAQVKEWNGKVMFMHKIAPGIANRSYGINVAELAGIPQEVVERAKTILHELHDDANSPKEKKHELDLFNYKNAKTNNSELEKFLEGVNPDELSPKEALEILYKLSKLGNSRNN